MVRWILAAALALAASGAWAGPEGRIGVVDADTLDVSGVRVRLFGIDAPERDQTCTRPDGTVWRCGLWAAEEVRSRWGGRTARCEAVDRDRHGRVVARCFVARRDIAAEIVRAGLATAYLRFSRDYLEVEKEAVVAGRGIFGSQMRPPAEHRAAQAGQAPPGRCAIKGNISGSGRIYHLPGQEHYARTRIDPARGERWFCTEAEARAAGWRRARR